ncbi:MAG: hypothetical protein SA339_04805 [Methanomassiliicoccus sp.]|nr:hypothetical protein [Methanomassiliicoccus sp.]
MSILPLATGKLQVSVPEGEGGGPVAEGNKVTLTVPVDITNDGYFNIEDLTVRFRVADRGVVLTEQSSVPVDVIAGRTNHLNLTITLDMDTISEERLKDLVFNSTTLDLNVGVEAGYSLGLVKASISTNQQMEWHPMVSNVSIDTSNIQWHNNGTSMDLLVPYSFDASEFAQGKAVGMQATLMNSTAVLGTASQELTVGPHNSGQFRFVVSQQAFQWLQSHPEALTIGADLSLMGATMHFSRSIPSGGLT